MEVSRDLQQADGAAASAFLKQLQIYIRKEQPVDAQAYSASYHLPDGFSVVEDDVLTIFIYEEGVTLFFNEIPLKII